MFWALLYNCHYCERYDVFLFKGVSIRFRFIFSLKDKLWEYVSVHFLKSENKVNYVFQCWVTLFSFYFHIKHSLYFHKLCFKMQKRYERRLQRIPALCNTILLLINRYTTNNRFWNRVTIWLWRPKIEGFITKITIMRVWSTLNVFLSVFTFGFLSVIQWHIGFVWHHFKAMYQLF